MLTITDILLSAEVTSEAKHALVDLMERERIYADVRVLTPTATNDDVNGSTHVRSGGTDFTYRDATESDVRSGSALGYYEYFSNEDHRTYTGHYYQGSGGKFEAVVVDPPTYAATVHY